MITALPPSHVLPPILHYSAAEPFTKYEMCLVFAKIVGLPHKHIDPDAEPPKVCTRFSAVYHAVTHQMQGEAATTRPRDCQLYTRETEDLMEGYGGLGWTPFEDWWTAHLTSQAV